MRSGLLDGKRGALVLVTEQSRTYPSEGSTQRLSTRLVTASGIPLSSVIGRALVGSSNIHDLLDRIHFLQSRVT